MGYMDSITDLGSVFGSGGGAGIAGAFNPMVALGSFGGEAASAWYGNRMAEKRQHEAFDQQLMMMQNRYQMQTKDMMAAGLNPMLATSQGAPMPGGVGQAPVSKPDLVAAMSNAVLASAQSAKIREETENIKIENSNLRDTGTILQKTASKLDAEIDEINQKIKTNSASEAEIKRRTELLDIQSKLIEVQVKLGGQEFDIKHPEQVASGSQGAEIGAYISRALKPLIDALGGAAKIGK